MQAERRTEDKGVFDIIKGFESAYMTMVRVINKNLLDEVSSQAKTSPRLRMNYNFHQSLDEKCHRMLNSVEPGQTYQSTGIQIKMNHLLFSAAKCVLRPIMMTVLL